MSGYNEDLQPHRMDLNREVQAEGIFWHYAGAPPQHKYLWENLIKEIFQFKRHQILTSFSPDFLETQPQTFLLGSWSQNPPASHPEHPRRASRSQSLFLPEDKPGNKALGTALWVGGFPFSFVAQFPALERDKKRNWWVIQHLRSWRGEFITGKKVQELFCTCRGGVWGLKWSLAVHRVERLETNLQIKKLLHREYVEGRTVECQGSMEGTECRVRGQISQADRKSVV